MANAGRFLQSKAKGYKLVFENETLKDLWDKELSGQISDGMWENTANSCWQFWCNIETTVGDANQITTTDKYGIYSMAIGIKRNFGFTRLMKNNWVFDRMIEIGKKYDPSYNEKKLRKDLQAISKMLKADIVMVKGEEAV